VGDQRAAAEPPLGRPPGRSRLGGAMNQVYACPGRWITPSE